MDKKEQARLRKQRQRERDKQRDTTDANVTLVDVTQGDMSRADVTLDAVNAVLERRGMPRVRKGVEPMLPFDKKVQASRKRM